MATSPPSAFVCEIFALKTRPACESRNETVYGHRLELKNCAPCALPTKEVLLSPCARCGGFASRCYLAIPERYTAPDLPWANQPRQANLPCRLGAPLPNRSLKPTRYGRRCKPGLSQRYYRLSPGLQHLPPRAGYLER